MSNNRICPFVRRMRVNGGTIYCFSSAVEDIGINISERNNDVAIRNFALLNIPPIRVNDGTKTLQENAFNLTEIAGAWTYEDVTSKSGTVLIAESFQNYALNLEANLLNQSTYNPALSTTVSERVFWKWLKETGAIRWTKDISSGYFTEELASPGAYQSVVQYVGLTTTGNLRIDTFGTYNESYIQVPTSHGQTRSYFKYVTDDNYYPELIIGPGNDKILGRETYVLPHPDGLSYYAYYDIFNSSTSTVGVGDTYAMSYKEPSAGSWTPGWWYSNEGINPPIKSYIVDPSAFYFDTSVYNVDLQYVGSSITRQLRRSNIDCLSVEFDLNNLKIVYNDPNLTFDKIAIDYSTDDQFYFNTVLLYYNVYNKNSNIPLATNLLGVLFLDSPVGNIATTIEIPLLEKIASSGNTFGNSYSFRINIKSDNMVDDTAAVIVDQATSDQTIVNDLTGVMDSLTKSLNILTQQSATVNTISQQYTQIQSNEKNITNQIQGLQQQINTIDDMHGTNLGSGDASVYISVEDFVFKFKSLKSLDNSTGDKILIIDSSIDNLIKFDLSLNKYVKEASIGNSLSWIGGLLEVSSNFTVPSNVIVESSLGTQFYWSGGLLNVSVGTGGGVSQTYIDGSLAARDTSITYLYLQDASNVKIYGNQTISGNKTFTGNSSFNTIVSSLIPDNSTRDLGSLTNPWGKLYVSASTIFFDNVPVSVVNGTMLVNNSSLSTVTYVNTQVSGVQVNAINASISAYNASTSAYNAATSASNASTNAYNAATSASNASTNAYNAQNAASSALTTTNGTTMSFNTSAAYSHTGTISSGAGYSVNIPYGKTYLSLTATGGASGTPAAAYYYLDGSCNMFFASVGATYGNSQAYVQILQGATMLFQLAGPGSSGAYHRYVFFIKLNGNWICLGNSATNTFDIPISV